MTSSQTPRIFQQQPPSDTEADADQQQKPGASDQQQAPEATGQQMGEGSYEGTRDYNERTAEYLKKGTVEQDMEKSKPRSEQEAREMRRAEDEGRSHSKGEH